MAPLTRLVSAAIVMSSAVYYGEPAAAVVGVTDDCLMAANLARSAKLGVRLSVLQKSTELETASGTAITTNNLAGNSKDNCAMAANVTAVSEAALGVFLGFPAGADGLNCASLFQNLLVAGLTALKDYSEQAWNNGSAAPYNTAVAQNFVYLLHASSATMGCSATSDCVAGQNVLLCRFQPSITAAENTAPMTAAFYQALVARQDAGVDITKLTKDDINTDPSGAPGGDGGNNALGVAPTASILVLSLIGLVSRL